MSYWRDANVFIQAKNLHYGLDFCPAFWQWLIEALHTAPFVPDHVPAASRSGCQNARIARMLSPNKTRQGYARERILKPAGYFFVPQQGAVL